MASRLDCGPTNDSNATMTDVDSPRLPSADRSSQPTFSVVVPAYNAESTIAATLRSVLGQTRPDFEVIVVDDGSHDQTAAVVERVGDDRVRVIRRANAGVAMARNAGIAKARGRYISFLDADDVWLPTYLETMAAALEKHPDAGFAFTDAWVWDEATGRFGRGTIMATGNPPEHVPSEPHELFRLLLDGNFVFTSATVRREVLDEVGGFDQAVSPSEDWELWLRITARGHSGIRAAPVLAVYRVRAGSLSADREVMRGSKRKGLEAASGYRELPQDLRGFVSEHLARHTLETTPMTRESPPTAARLPAVLRLRSYRLRPPRGVPRGILSLLRSPQRIS